MTTDVDTCSAALQHVADQAAAGSCTAQMLNASSRLSGIAYELFNRVYLKGQSKTAAAHALGLDAERFRTEHSSMLRALKTSGQIAPN